MDDLTNAIESIFREGMREIARDIARRHNEIVRDIRRWRKLCNEYEAHLGVNEEGETCFSARYYQAVLEAGDEILRKQRDLRAVIDGVSELLGVDLTSRATQRSAHTQPARHGWQTKEQ